MQVDKDTFSHIPICHINDGAKSVSFTGALILLKLLLKSIATGKNTVKLYSFKTQALMKLGIIDSKSFACFSTDQERKKNKS